MRAGKLIDIPDERDRPNHFTVRPSRPGQVGERLTIIVTPTPLKDVTVGDKPMQLSQAQVDSWQKAWGAPVQKFVQDDTTPHPGRSRPADDLPGRRKEGGARASPVAVDWTAEPFRR